MASTVTVMLNQLDSCRISHGSITWDSYYFNFLESEFLSLFVYWVPDWTVKNLQVIHRSRSELPKFSRGYCWWLTNQPSKFYQHFLTIIHKILSANSEKWTGNAEIIILLSACQLFLSFDPLFCRAGRAEEHHNLISSSVLVNRIPWRLTSGCVTEVMPKCW